MTMKVAATRAENSGFVLAARSPVGNCRKKVGLKIHFEIQMVASAGWPITQHRFACASCRQDQARWDSPNKTKTKEEQRSERKKEDITIVLPSRTNSDWRENGWNHHRSASKQDEQRPEGFKKKEKEEERPGRELNTGLAS
jgi:hypothetical protein